MGFFYQGPLKRFRALFKRVAGRKPHRLKNASPNSGSHKNQKDLSGSELLKELDPRPYLLKQMIPPHKRLLECACKTVMGSEKRLTNIRNNSGGVIEHQT